MSNHRAEVEVDSPSLVDDLEKAYAAPAVVRTSPVTGSVDMGDLAQVIKNILHDELGHMIGDIERRYAMALEAEGPGRRAVGASDLNLLTHLVEGYTVTSNSPSAGLFAWTNLHIVYGGVDYTIADGAISNTNNKYVWFVKPASYTPGTPVTLSQGTSQPTLVNGDTMVFVMNTAGVPTSTLERTGSSAVADPGSINDAAIASGLSATKIAGVLATGNIPGLPATQITSGTFTATQIPTLDAGTKLTGTAPLSVIPGLPATQVTSGTFTTSQIPTLDAGTKLSGTAPLSIIPALPATQVTSGTFNQAQIPTLGAAKLSLLTHLLY